MTAPAEDPRSGEAEVCPNRCNLDYYGTHQGPPDCDLLPRDPNWYNPNADPPAYRPPAAGRGDTDSSGEGLADVAAAFADRDDMPDRPVFPPARPTARPAVDRAEPPEGLRERPRCACGGPCEHDGSLAREQLFHAAYDLIVDHPMWIDGEGRGLEYSPEREAHIGQFLEQLLALPELRRPLGGPS